MPELQRRRGRSREQLRAAEATAPEVGKRSIAGEQDDYFVQTFAYFTAFDRFRVDAQAPARVQQLTPALDLLAERVRNAVGVFTSSQQPDRERRALELWGGVRASVEQVIARARAQGSDIDAAAAGFERMDAYLTDSCAERAIEICSRASLRGRRMALST